jgi:hypothetical protein
MDDIFTQDNDDSYREINFTNGFAFKANNHCSNNSKATKLLMANNGGNDNRMIVDKFKTRNDVIEDQLDDFNDSLNYTKNEYIQMAFTYKSLCKVSQGYY